MESSKTTFIAFGIIVIILIGIVGLFAYTLTKDSSTNANSSNNQNNNSNIQITNTPLQTMTPTQSSANIPLAQKDYKVTLQTDLGDIVVQVTKATPKTTGNFVKLAQEGFYNNVIFHRTIDGFMIQGGDPTGTGSGGPGYKFEDEKFDAEYSRGTIAMANSGPNTNGSQFFIMHADYPLPKNYTIFGKVISGIEIVDKIATAPVKSNGFGENSSPVNPVKIKSTKVEEI